MYIYIVHNIYVRSEVHKYVFYKKHCQAIIIAVGFIIHLANVQILGFASYRSLSRLYL